jgi:alpha/beta superfamily hydrolase
MYDGVVTEIFRQGQASRNFGAVLKYNMRGVGGSDGQGLVSRMFGSLPRVSCDYDVHDVTHVIEFLIKSIERENPSVEARVAIVGYSYGAALAARAAAQHPRVCQYVGISIPIGTVASFFLNSKHHCMDMLYMSRDIPRLLVLGKNDQYTSERQLVECVRKSGRVLAEMSSPEEHVSPLVKSMESGGIRVDIFENNDHFWGNDCACMIEHVMSWLVVAS